MKRNKIIDAIIDSELIEPGSVIIVGLSGGPDSLCLLHALNEISDAFSYELIPVHVNHHLRPEADDEAYHAEEMCDRMNLECRVYDADCMEMAEELGISTEEAGRNIRYQIFDDVRADLEEEGHRPDRIIIALGHNADDQCETVLFRLLRGTGPHGLAGIPAYRMSASGCPIVRPLLKVERKDIEEYIRVNRLRPNIDKSNEDSKYTRNRIRNELIPYLEQNYNPRIKETLRRYAALADMDDRFLKEVAFIDYTDNLEVDAENRRVTLDLTNIRDNPPAVNSRIVTYILDLIDLESVATYENVNAVMEILYGEHPSSGVDLPMGIRVFREYDKLIFSGSEETVRADEGTDILPHIVMIKDFHPDDDIPYAAFDFDKFDAEHPGRIGDLTLRTRQEGDYLPIKDGSKKIQDLLVDSKVKKNARDSIRMVCMDSEVLWVLPSAYFSGEREKEKGKFSSKYHITDTTERVLFVEIVDAI